MLFGSTYNPERFASGKKEESQTVLKFELILFGLTAIMFTVELRPHKTTFLRGNRVRLEFDDGEISYRDRDENDYTVGCDGGFLCQTNWPSGADCWYVEEDEDGFVCANCFCQYCKCCNIKKCVRCGHDRIMTPWNLIDELDESVRAKIERTNNFCWTDLANYIFCEECTAQATRFCQWCDNYLCDDCGPTCSQCF